MFSEFAQGPFLALLKIERIQEDLLESVEKQRNNFESARVQRGRKGGLDIAHSPIIKQASKKRGMDVEVIIHNHWTNLSNKFYVSPPSESVYLLCHQLLVKFSY